MDEQRLRAAPGEPFTVDDHFYRWPMGAEKCELIDGIAIWYGEFIEADVDAARRAFPGHKVALDRWDGDRGNLLVGPASIPASVHPSLAELFAGTP